jgi:hypothetical protein
MSQEIASNEPVMLHEGRYRLYQNPDGGMHLVYRPEGQDTDMHMEVPGALIRLSEQAATGKISPMQMMRSVMGFMGGHG